MFSRIVTLICTAISFVALVFSPALRAQAFDPTRPPTLQRKAAPASQPVKVDPKDYQATLVLVSQQRQVAVINNQVVSVGDSVTAGDGAKATVVAIATGEITLRKGSREFMVRLPSSHYPKNEPDSGMKDQP